MESSSPALPVQYFDGKSARAQHALLRLEGQQLLVQLPQQELRYASRALQWPERQRHGQRQLLLPDGGVVLGADARAWDDWAQAVGRRDSLVVRWMQDWRWVALSLLLLVVLVGGGWRWGLPQAARAIAAVVPDSVQAHIDKIAMGQLEGIVLKPSTLSAERQAQLRQRFAQLLRQAQWSGPAYRLEFRSAPKAVGPNAFALPGGTLVMTDALVTLMADQEDGILGVLGHELGHVQHRHGMRMLVQGTVVGAVTGLWLGDFSALAAAVPALLATSSYSREAEREADTYARDLLRAAGVSTEGTAVFFERIAELHGEDKPDDDSAQEPRRKPSLPLSIASHPDSAERVQFFRAP
ncbi:M48 family metallopeptidase [Roseateles sp. BYS180W]|uniref:M48 family metallopeptidase n=1 Tax=Roseateles rivi TaxID=3299028 RepID=A0ABW7FTB5_9BURK